MSTEPLYATDHEEAVLGAGLVSSGARDTMQACLVTTDLGLPKNQAIFESLLELHRAGAAVDPLSVHEALKRAGAAWPTALADLVALQANTASTASTATHAAVVADRALRRRAIAELTARKDSLYDLTVDPGQLLDEHRAALAEIDSPVLVRAPGDIDVNEFVQQVDERGATVIPGLVDEDDRVIIVAPEGVGKTELMRQITTCAVHGLNPFTLEPVPAVPALLIDLENPHQLVRRRLGYLEEVASNASAGRARAPARLWHKPGGIDLRKRMDRVAFEDVLRRCRPKLVCAGPVYKCYVRKANESDEQVASEVQAVLDDLRVRYHFALLLEHHAPQASNGTREMRPFGSSLWLRWPEYGISLKPDSRRANVLVLGRWRGDRSQAHWPDELHRGSVWPWEGRWTTGMPSREVRDDPEF